MTVTISPVNMEDRQKIGIRAGDTVRVWQKLQEKGKTRLQAFEGLVLARKHGNEAGASFTVRKVSNGVGVEKVFPLYSPMIDKIEVIKRSKVRRAKLYFIRDKVAREIRKQMRNMRMMDISTKSDIGEKEELKKAAEEAEVAAQKAEEEKVAKEAEAAAKKAEADKAETAVEAEDNSQKDSAEAESKEEEPKEEVKETPEETKEEEKKEETK